MSNPLAPYHTKSESFCHKAIKRLMYGYISENNKKSIIEKSLEKYIATRRADVYFRFTSGYEIVVEVQNSKISVKEIINRTEFYNKAGIFIMWILYGNGPCVASPKFPEDNKNIKISIMENFLHRMYGGRVYYVNINFYEDKTTISIPFALHFSPSSKKKNHKLFQTRYENYYIKNVNFTKIPSWNILCVNFNGYKLARFYDKNIKRVLKSLILDYYYTNLKSVRSNKKLINLIINQFIQKYGKFLILKAILELSKEKKIEFSQIIISKIKKKLYK
ncbi:MAG: hypothetical protein JSV62_04265 [Promethearchaeota archaeon]|nr:MAG: hypothetical protein JSV62_04265 [Candidatus Lokiarchaeota archaeon]